MQGLVHLLQQPHSLTRRATYHHVCPLLARTLQKLSLWATLVFFGYGSTLQISFALLLCVTRLMLQSHYDPYRDPLDNIFDYLCLIITALLGLGGVVLNSLQHEKALAIMGGDKERNRTTTADLNLISNGLSIVVIVVMVLFALFILHHVVLTQPRVRALIQKFRNMLRDRARRRWEQCMRPLRGVLQRCNTRLRPLRAVLQRIRLASSSGGDVGGGGGDGGSGGGGGGDGDDGDGGGGDGIGGGDGDGDGDGGGDGGGATDGGVTSIEMIGMEFAGAGETTSAASLETKNCISPVAYQHDNPPSQRRVLGMAAARADLNGNPPRGTSSSPTDRVHTRESNADSTAVTAAATRIAASATQVVDEDDQQGSYDVDELDSVTTTVAAANLHPNNEVTAPLELTSDNTSTSELTPLGNSVNGDARAGNAANAGDAGNAANAAKMTEACEARAPPPPPPPQQQQQPPPRVATVAVKRMKVDVEEEDEVAAMQSSLPSAIMGTNASTITADTAKARAPSGETHDTLVNEATRAEADGKASRLGEEADGGERSAARVGGAAASGVRKGAAGADAVQSLSPKKPQMREHVQKLRGRAAHNVYRRSVMGSSESFSGYVRTENEERRECGLERRVQR